jgi:hypothetical protein
MIWVEAKTQAITGAFTRERRLLEKRANVLASAASAAKRHREYVEELQVLCGGHQMMVDGRERAVLSVEKPTLCHSVFVHMAPDAGHSVTRPEVADVGLLTHGCRPSIAVRVSGLGHLGLEVRLGRPEHRL